MSPGVSQTVLLCPPTRQSSGTRPFLIHPCCEGTAGGQPAKKHPFRGSILTAMRLLQVKKVTPEVQLFSWQQKEFGRAQLNRLRPPHLEDFEVRTPLLPAAAPAAVRGENPLVNLN